MIHSKKITIGNLEYEVKYDELIMNNGDYNYESDVDYNLVSAYCIDMDRDVTNIINSGIKDEMLRLAKHAL
jgi:hypothetical protein